jgi:hypothetical protein
MIAVKQALMTEEAIVIPLMPTIFRDYLAHLLLIALPDH